MHNLKLKFLQNIPKFNFFLSKSGEEGYKIIKNHIINVIFELVQDKKSAKVSDLACEVLVEITKELKEDDKGSCVLSNVLSKFIKADSYLLNLLI